MISFFVEGHPEHQGNMVPRGRGLPGVRDKNAKKLHPWRDKIKERAQEEYAGEPLGGPVALSLTFYMARPTTHFGTGRNAALVKESSPRFPTTRPDIDKLTRGVLDAGTDVLWEDDSRIVDLEVFERYVDRLHPQEGVNITVGVVYVA